MAAFGYNASDEELAQLEQLRQELVRHLTVLGCHGLKV